MAPRTYRVDQANGVLPEVRRLTARVVELSVELPEFQDRLRIAEYRLGRAAAGAEERDTFREAAAALRQAEDEMVGAIRALEEMGVQLKDPRMGLVDFLSYRDGELVELCWKLGEERVGHWHHIGEGYAGRKPL